MGNVVIIGSSGHAKVLIDIVEREGRFKIVGLLDKSRAVGEETLGYPVLGCDVDLPQLVPENEIKGALLAIGDNYVRFQAWTRIRAACPDLPFVTAVHPRASIARDVAIGEGTVIMAGVVVNPCCSVGRFCILNSSSSLDHDSVMEDFASLAPGVVTGGNCRIGSGTAISIGAVLMHGIEVGEHTVVGAGATVLEAIPSYKVAYGTPAKAVRDRKPGDRYL